MKLLKSKRKLTNPPLKNLFETSVWRTIHALFKKIDIPTWEFEVSYEKEKFGYTLHKTYKPDFEIMLSNGDRRYVEAKGYFRPADRTKILAVLRDNPHLDLRLLFKSDNTLSKGSRNRYSDWATKHSIPFAVGELPPEWLQ